MPDRTHRTTFAVGAWLAAVIGTGAWAAHFFYNGGKALADVVRNKTINAPIDWLAGLCRRADFADFHLFSITLFTVLGTIPFLPWLLRKPDGPVFSELAALRHDRSGLRQVFQAIPLCLAFALSTTFIAHGASGVVLLNNPILWLSGACAAGLAAELIFRGVVPRLVSTDHATPHAIVASSLLHLVFFSSLSPHGIDSWESVLSSGRFPFAASLASAFSEPALLFGKTLPLLLAGLALGWARTRSPSLWLVAGIQAGFLLAWRITPHGLPALLSVALTVFVFLGRPSFPSYRAS